MPLFAPIIVGPVTDQRLCHADGELATVRGASAAQAAVAVSRRSSHSVQAMAAQATTPLIFQAFADDGPTKVRSQAQDAVRPIVDAVGAQVPVLRDGGIRRGTDVMKALASGARAVQSVIEMLQTELGRVMGCCGTPSLAAITNRVVKIHAAQPTRERV